MFLQLQHKNLEVYQHARKLVKACYLISKELPADEKFILVPQIRRAALSVKLNIAEGCSRFSSQERKRFYEIARGSIIEIDAAFETIVDLNYIELSKLEDAGVELITTFKMLSGLINKTTK
jgi:four helix bundle protein